MACKLCNAIGIVLVAISAAGLLLAGGNLITLPFIQSQLVKVVPDAESAITEAVAQSRRKSYYGVGVCSPILVLGAVLILSRRRNKTGPDRNNVDSMWTVAWRHRRAISEPDSAANGSQPIRSENNPMSSAAGSRR
jgi:hypothetical protein